MEFIRVTLCENILTSNKTVSQQGKADNYLLPVNGIKSISEKQTEPGVYYIEICDNYIPKDLDIDFEVHHAIAKLPKDFIDVVN